MTVRPLAVDGDDTRLQAPESLEVAPEGSGRLDLRVVWPGEGHPAALEVRASEWFEGPAGEHTVLLETVLRGSDEEVSRASRRVRIREGVESLVEVLADGDRHLTLAVRAEKVMRPVVRRVSATGVPVRLALTVYSLREGKAYPLEDNDLRTIEGENVSYEFRRGEGDSLETLRLDLRPTRIAGELIEIEVRLRGTLHTLPSPLYVERSEHWMTSRGASSRLDAASGEPPSGYRFQVVPLF